MLLFRRMRLFRTNHISFGNTFYSPWPSRWCLKTSSNTFCSTTKSLTIFYKKSHTLTFLQPTFRCHTSSLRYFKAINRAGGKGRDQIRFSSNNVQKGKSGWNLQSIFGKTGKQKSQGREIRRLAELAKPEWNNLGGCLVFFFIMLIRR